MVQAFDSHDEAALERVNEFYGRSFTFDDLWAEIWRRVYAFRQRSSRVPKNYLDPTEAQMVIAQDAGFGSWAALTQAMATGLRPVPPFALDIGGEPDCAAAPIERSRVGRGDCRDAEHRSPRSTRKV